MSNLISKIVVPDSSEETGYALYNIKDANAIRSSEKGAANGVATLDSSGKVTSSQLPSEQEVEIGTTSPVDDVKLFVDEDGDPTYDVYTKAETDDLLDEITDLIPAQATTSNQLADKAFVNSSISTATATYRGCYNLVSDLSLTTQASHGLIETALGTAVSGTPDNNDYAFVQIPTADATPTEIASVERYKFNGTLWSFEYTLNNSGFTAAQWAAVNSNITSGLVTKLNALSTNNQSSVANLFGMDSNGNFLNINTSDLASVLGALFIDLKTSLDLNSAKATAKYNVGPSYVSGVSNLPNAISSSSSLLSLIIDVVAVDNYIVQKVYVANTNATFQRTCTNNTWSDWQRTDNYGTSTISELASTLGGLRYIDDINMPTNLDAVLTQGQYRGNPAGTIFTNVEQVFVYVINNGLTVVQYVVGQNSGKIISRVYNGSTWSTWQRLDAFGCATESALASLIGAIINGGWTISTHPGSDHLRNVTGEDGIIFEGPANDVVYASWKFLFTIGGDLKLGFAATRDNGANWTTYRFE